ncbi:MAG: hypothetical protein PHF30_00600 [Bacilli bacterium]|nr:hypothetical protein [Bacilli bacterium]
MKNFLQFIIPLLIIIVIGCIMFFNSTSYDDTKKLYIKCDNVSEKFDVYSNLEITFAKKNDACKLDIEISNVDQEYVKINTKYLWGLNYDNTIDDSEPNTSNIISINKKTTLYSYDKKTKYIFEYK